MAFLDSFAGRVSSVQETALVCAVAVFTLEGELDPIERRVISLFRDQFPPLSNVPEPLFAESLDRAIEAEKRLNIGADLAGFVRHYIAAGITAHQDRVDLYRYAYALAMTDLNVAGEQQTLLAELRTGLGLTSAEVNQAEQAVMAEFRSLYRAMTAAAVGLLVVSANGKVNESELQKVRDGRSFLEPIGRLNDREFELVFELSLHLHDQYLLNPDNRKAFLEQLVPQMFDQQRLRLQAFEYATKVATSDTDMAQAEIDMLKQMLIVLGINDADGEAIFHKYMERIQTIDGKPR